jgi:hypothetical protein
MPHYVGSIYQLGLVQNPRAPRRSEVRAYGCTLLRQSNSRGTTQYTSCPCSYLRLCISALVDVLPALLLISVLLCSSTGSLYLPFALTSIFRSNVCAHFQE